MTISIQDSLILDRVLSLSPGSCSVMPRSLLMAVAIASGLTQATLSDGKRGDITPPDAGAALDDACRRALDANGGQPVDLTKVLGMMVKEGRAA